MKKYIIFFSILALLVGCAGKSKNMKSVYKDNQASGKKVPEFSVFKGSKSGTKITSEKIEESKIETTENEEIQKEEIPEGAYVVDGFLVKDIHFDFDSYIIKPEDLPYLEKLAEFLKDHPTYKITIEGHCDERGSEMYNLALGQRRANAVKDFLINLGIDSSRINTISYGEEKPLDPGHNETAWAKNRRCHFVVEK